MTMGEQVGRGLGTNGRGPLPLSTGRTAIFLRVPMPGARQSAEEAMGEAHLPAQQPQTSQEPRLSSPHVDEGGPSGAEGTTAEGPAPAVGLTWRVRDRGTFARLRTEGTRTSSGPVTVIFVGDEVATPPRVAYSVGRRIGPAVVRNRLRRRLRAIVADAAAQLAPGAYLISAGPRAAQMSFADLRSAVGGALDRMRTTVNRTGGNP